LADGSFEQYFSNGTYRWFAAPASNNESAEQYAFRVVKSEFFNGTKTATFANGTVVQYRPDGSMIYIVKPTSFFITR
jgi:hypothetical protein